jgi:hypothetical protein
MLSIPIVPRNNPDNTRKASSRRFCSTAALGLETAAIRTLMHAPKPGEAGARRNGSIEPALPPLP